MKSPIDLTWDQKTRLGTSCTKPQEKPANLVTSLVQNKHETCVPFSALTAPSQNSEAKRQRAPTHLILPKALLGHSFL